METLCLACAEIFTGGDDRKPAGEMDWSGVEYLHHRSFDDFRAGLRVECMFCITLNTAYGNQYGDFSEAIQQGTEPFKITYHWRRHSGLGMESSKEEDDEDEEEKSERAGTLEYEEKDLDDSDGSEVEDRDSGSVVAQSPMEIPQTYWLFVGYWPGDNDVSIGRFLLKPKVNPWAYIYTPDGNTGSESSLALMKQWVDYCVMHDACVDPPPDTVSLPTRVIDVGNLGENNVRLHITRHSNIKTGHYMTLSHCWGAANLPKCTQAKLEELQKGFELSSLPKTFRDAIEVTRSLGVHFLWIDSLCILQDSPEDWAHEAGMIGDVYRNCFVNIAATASKDSDGGLFFERRVSDAKALEVEIDWPAEPRESRISYQCWDANLWHSDLEQAAVNTRGWVTQERLFSPRVLHFGRRQLWWECGARSACEKSIRGNPDYSVSYGQRPWRYLLDSFKAAEQTPIESMTKKQRVTRWREWWVFVEAYTERDFTFTSDKLIAISAVAKAMMHQHAAAQDDYLAGLWRWWFELDLHWYVDHGTYRSASRTYRPKDDDGWRAPSWSWASVDGPVIRPYNTPDDKVTSLLRVLRTEILPKFGNDCTGQLKGASLTVECRMFFSEWLLLRMFDCLDDAKMMGSHGSRVIFGELHFDDFDLACALADEGRARVMCLPGMYLPDSFGGPMDRMGKGEVRGLIVEAVPNADRHYRRIGLFVAYTSLDELYSFVEEEAIQDMGQVEVTLL